MSLQLAKYVARAPRYVLQPQDDTFIRLGGPHQSPWEENTEILNLSLTGLSFVAPADLCPIVGEIIKIQFEIPNTGPLACLGLITRLDVINDHQMQVGLHFVKLDPLHKLELIQALAKKLKIRPTSPSKKLTSKMLFSFIKQNKLAIVSFISVILFLTSLLVYLLFK
jgi:hypothetical protein